MIFFNLKFASDSGDGRCEGEFTNKNKFNTCFFFNLKLKFKIRIEFFFFNLKFASDSGDGRCEGEFTNKNKFDTFFFFNLKLKFKI